MDQLKNIIFSDLYEIERKQISVLKKQSENAKKVVCNIYLLRTCLQYLPDLGINSISSNPCGKNKKF